MTRRVATALMGAALLSGCLSPAPDDGGPPREGPLVALDALVPTDDDGPLDAGAVRVACVEAGWAVEGESFEVNTDGCDPGIFVAPLLVNVAPGDTITFTRWHLALDAPLPTVGRMALALDEELLWSETFSIPSAEDVGTVEVTAGEAHAAGAPLRLLVENHGANSYRFTRLRWRAGSG